MTIAQKTRLASVKGQTRMARLFLTWALILGVAGGVPAGGSALAGPGPSSGGPGLLAVEQAHVFVKDKKKGKKKGKKGKKKGKKGKNKGKKGKNKGKNKKAAAFAGAVARA